MLRRTFVARACVAGGRAGCGRTSATSESEAERAPKTAGESASEAVASRLPPSVSAARFLPLPLAPPPLVPSVGSPVVSSSSAPDDSREGSRVEPSTRSEALVARSTSEAETSREGAQGPTCSNRRASVDWSVV